MKIKHGLPLLLALVLLLSACGEKQLAQEPDGLQLWFPSDESLSGYGHGPALDCEPYEKEGTPQPEELLSVLLAGPTQEGLRSPFPQGVTLRQCGWDEERPGVLMVNLSEQYGALADVSLTLADYCIVLTLSQLDEVETVEITAEGRHASYRSHQLLNAQEAVLWDELAETQKTLDNSADSR